MITPDKFDIVQRHGTQQCRIRIVIKEPEKGDDGMMDHFGTFIWLSSSRYNEPFEGPEEAARVAVLMARDMFGDVFARSLVAEFLERGLLNAAPIEPKEDEQ